MRITKKKAAVVIAVSAVAMAGAGGAYAYWTTGGTGTGSASAGTNQNFTIAQTNTITNLYPGIAQTVNFTVTNPATYAQYLTAVAIAPGAPTGGAADGAKPACAANDFAITGVTISAGDIAGGGNRTGTATITLTNKVTNQDNCKNVSVPLAYTAS